MRKVVFSLLVIAGFSFAANKANAQTAPLKIGVFDIDQMVQAMPEMKDVQTKVEGFQRDSLGPQKDNLDTLFANAQNTYKNDSLAKKSASILSYDRTQLQNIYYQEMNWQQIVQQATQQKYQELAAPYYKKAGDAFQKAVADNHITIVLKPDAIQYADDKQITNLFVPVAKTLGVNINPPADGQGPAPSK
ncbi:MAG TPA: OmpH family outer membrane protein [Arachidicoccus sp.]